MVLAKKQKCRNMIKQDRKARNKFMHLWSINLGKSREKYTTKKRHSVSTIGKTGQFSSVTQSCSTLCDPMDNSMTGLPVHHQLLESTQTHVH